MAQDTTEHPNTLTLRINAGADYVIGWLKYQTKNAPLVDILRSENGMLKVATGEQRDPWPVENVIQVQVHALENDRCEVIVRHPWPDYAGWPAEMLERMAESYPESRPAIDRHLALIRAASPAVDQVKTASEPPADGAIYPTDAGDDRLAKLEAFLAVAAAAGEVPAMRRLALIAIWRENPRILSMKLATINRAVFKHDERAAASEDDIKSDIVFLERESGHTMRKRRASPRAK